MALLIRKPSESRYLKLCGFAPAGAGKTVLLGTAELDERTAPCLGLDFEGGTESLSGLDIDVAPISAWKDFNEAYELLASGDSGYKSVFLDSISEVHKFALLAILKEQGPSRKDPDLLEQRDYGTATVQMRRLLREFRDLPMHVMFSAHAKEIEIPREGRVRIPDLAGQMAEEISGIVSVQGYLAQFEEDGELHRTMLLHSFPKFRIKARTPWGVVAPEEIIDPTMTKILDALGYGDGTFVQSMSSRGKQHVEDEVGPGVEEEVKDELRKEVEDKSPPKKADVTPYDEPPAEDEVEPEAEDGEAESTEDPDAVPEDDNPGDDASQGGLSPEEVRALKIGPLREYAEGQSIENASKKTRGQLLRLLGATG